MREVFCGYRLHLNANPQPDWVCVAINVTEKTICNRIIQNVTGESALLLQENQQPDCVYRKM